MEAAAASVVTACAPLAGAVGLGWFLRRSICTETDGETAARFALWVTLPSLILQSFNGVPLAAVQLPVLAGYAAATALSAAIAWIAYRARHPKERGLLAGSSVGANVALVGVPLAGALFGMEGHRAALLCAAVNGVAAWVLSYLLFSTAGPAFPDSFKHADGGRYRGEWKGMLKEGHGAYFYPSGARYEGEWREGLKEGRGVYHFPKGGVYEGEWREGVQSGVGVRTFGGGRVQAGVWESGKLKLEMEERQCALAVQGANDAAAVATRVRVGGGGWGAALRLVSAQPATWAFLAAAALAALQLQLPPTIDAVTRQLEVAHAPLALIALGLSLDLQPVQQQQIAEVGEVLSIRLLPPLVLAGAAAAVSMWLGSPARATMALIGPATLCALAPVPPLTLAFAHAFRLNENLAAALTRAGITASLLLMPLLGAAAMVAAAADCWQIFVAAACVAAVAVALGGAIARNRGGRAPSRVRMVYSGAPKAAEAKALEEAAQVAAQRPTVGAPPGHEASAAADLMGSGGARPPPGADVAAPPTDADSSQWGGSSSGLQATGSPHGRHKAALRRRIALRHGVPICPPPNRLNSTVSRASAALRA